MVNGHILSAATFLDWPETGIWLVDSHLPATLARLFMSSLLIWDDELSLPSQLFAADLSTTSFAYCCFYRRYPDVMVHRLLAAALDLRQQQEEQGIVPHHPLLNHPSHHQQEDDGSPPETETPEGSEWEEISQEDDNASGSGLGEDGCIAEALSREVLEEHQIPGTKELEKIAEHSNKTKLSAKTVQEGSLKLCLCMLLRDSPAVVWGVVCGLGGDQFFTVYLPEFGFE